jgi:UDP-N-acetylglucosamine diphosphorylase/glucosamine-1-phosphate N-acetyltransferase
MHIILVDTKDRQAFLPFTANKAMADLQYGIFTIKERWEQLAALPIHVATQPYLQGLYETIVATNEVIWVNAAVIPTATCTAVCRKMEPGKVWQDETGWIACKPLAEHQHEMNSETIHELVQQYTPIAQDVKVDRLSNALQMMQTNEDRLRLDFAIKSKGKFSQPVSEATHVFGVANIFIEEGATIHASVINASTGPVYIGKNALIMEGCLLRGPISIGEGAVLKMGTKVYGGTTIGNYAVAGGEIKNTILMAYSNKAHDGYLGDSIIGEWCNIGAGTSNSNVKNTGSNVNMWNATTKSFTAVGNKCGLMMGDYSRVAINSSINTGTWIGICANVFGAGLLPKFIPDFSWGASAAEYYKIDNAIKHIENWKQMKNKHLSAAEKNVLRYIFEQITQ